MITKVRARSVFGRQEFVLLVFNEVISLYLLKKKKKRRKKKTEKEKEKKEEPSKL